MQGEGRAVRPENARIHLGALLLEAAKLGDEARELAGGAEWLERELVGFSDGHSDQAPPTVTPGTWAGKMQIILSELGASLRRIDRAQQSVRDVLSEEPQVALGRVQDLDRLPGSGPAAGLRR